ncbi:unnamed protein product [Cylindrotheca closterium]|uniref:V-ATPase proteolipid subunit C-like domain-containing protein n=1 Tax=Cylindrotheca closterium TaxID=2856 RepID=A0AAD2CSW7_9STRA|nr:unnamed protein product [Cylindrotheca closterium]
MTLADPQLLTGLGSALSIFLASTGSAIASAEGGIYALRKKGLTAFVPIIISGVLAIYGIIISILLVGKMGSAELTEVNGYRHLCAGLAVGLACLASGMGIARFLKHLNVAATITSDDSDRPESEPLIQRERRAMVNENFVHLALSLVFLEAIGLYGLIVALFLIGK